MKDLKNMHHLFNELRTFFGLCYDYKKPMIEWSHKEVVHWLGNIVQNKYLGKFIDENITGADLIKLREEDDAFDFISEVFGLEIHDEINYLLTQISNHAKETMSNY